MARAERSKETRKPKSSRKEEEKKTVKEHSLKKVRGGISQGRIDKF